MKDFYLRWWCGSETVLGIDLRDDGIFVAQSTTRASAEEAVKTFTIPLSSGVIQNGLITELPHVVSTLREWLHSLRLSGCRCAVALPPNATLIAWIDIPDDVLCVNERDLYEWALARLRLDGSQVRGKVFLETTQRRELLFVGAKLSVIETLEETFQALALDLSCITLRATAFHRGVVAVLKPSRGAVTIWLDLTDRLPALHVFEGEVLRHSRSLAGDASSGMGVLVSVVTGELRKVSASRDSFGEVMTYCAGSEELVCEFHEAWKSGGASQFPNLSWLSLVRDGKANAAHRSSHLVVTGLVQLLRESP